MKSNNGYAKKISLAFLLVIIVGVGVYLLNTAGQSSGKFCSSDDALYQTISSHASEWWGKNFNGISPSATLDFSSENGQRYTAIKANTPDPLFFVVVEYDSPHTYFERKGYIYAPKGIRSKRNEYRYTDIGKGIYCYEEI